MTKRTGIKRTLGNGHDRIEWMDAKRRTHAVRVTDAASVESVAPREQTRLPMKWTGQLASQGHYWCAGTGEMVWHESMSEFTVLMLLDHLFDIVNAVAQPMMLTFANGKHHTPDFFVVTACGQRILVDVHDTKLTTEDNALTFELTRLMCERVGWRYELFDSLPDVTRWSLEMMARYNHPRYAPDPSTRAWILEMTATHGAFGSLREALRTPLPGEHLPALFHLMWHRAIRFDLHNPFNDYTHLRVA